MVLLAAAAALALAQDFVVHVSEEFTAAHAAWVACLRAAAARYAPAAEPTETVVTAAFGACSREESLLRGIYVGDLGVKEGRAALAEERPILREGLTIVVVERRMGDERPRKASPPGGKPD
jgi:hypothetical protein